MKSVLSVCVAACISMAAVSAQGQSPDAQYSADLKVGDPAPAFSLPGSDGKVHSLSEYKGKTVVLAWFPKAFTGG
jgi:peroxiredoxin